MYENLDQRKFPAIQYGKDGEKTFSGEALYSVKLPTAWPWIIYISYDYGARANNQLHNYQP